MWPQQTALHGEPGQGDYWMGVGMGNMVRENMVRENMVRENMVRGNIEMGVSDIVSWGRPKGRHYRSSLVSHIN
jgi:hypothetical protein